MGPRYEGFGCNAPIPFGNSFFAPDGTVLPEVFKPPGNMADYRAMVGMHTPPVPLNLDPMDIFPRFRGQAERLPLQIPTLVLRPDEQAVRAGGSLAKKDKNSPVNLVEDVRRRARIEGDVAKRERRAKAARAVYAAQKAAARAATEKILRTNDLAARVPVEMQEYRRTLGLPMVPRTITPQPSPQPALLYPIMAGVTRTNIPLTLPHVPAVELHIPDFVPRNPVNPPAVETASGAAPRPTTSMLPPQPSVTTNVQGDDEGRACRQSVERGRQAAASCGPFLNTDELSELMAAVTAVQAPLTHVEAYVAAVGHLEHLVRIRGCQIDLHRERMWIRIQSEARRMTDNTSSTSSSDPIATPPANSRINVNPVATASNINSGESITNSFNVNQWMHSVSAPAVQGNYPAAEVRAEGGLAHPQVVVTSIPPLLGGVTITPAPNFCAPPMAVPPGVVQVTTTGPTLDLPREAWPFINVAAVAVDTMMARQQALAQSHNN
jgi:hypothetical protein